MGHLVQNPPLAHLFTVPFSEIEKRLATGGKFVDKPKPKGTEKKR